MLTRRTRSDLLDTRHTSHLNVALRSFVAGTTLSPARPPGIRGESWLVAARGVPGLAGRGDDCVEVVAEPLPRLASADLHRPHAGPDCVPMMCETLCRRSGRLRVGRFRSRFLARSRTDAR
jgi:hypothetical protein